MNPEEQRLSQLLKRTVPEPPFRLSADQITTRRAAPPARAWMLPAMAAAAVLAIGTTVGVLATHHSGASRPGGTRPAPGLSVAAPMSKAASPHPATSCHGATVIVPSVIGVTQDVAMAVAQQAGLSVEIRDAVPPASRGVAPGIVFSQSLAPGTRAVPGAVLEVTVAMAKAASTPSASSIDPGFAPTASSSPSPCQPVRGTPAARNATEVVPNVTGMARSQAVNVAEAAGFRVSVVTAAPPAADSVPPGTAFAQMPSAGSKAQPGSSVDIYVAAAS